MKQSNIEKQIDKYVLDWCWNNLGGDIDWDNNVHGHVLAGYNFAQKQYNKLLKDKYNHLNSELKQLTTQKLDKTVNEEKVAELKVKLELLKELINE